MSSRRRDTAGSSAPDHVRAILRAALLAADPDALVARRLRLLPDGIACGAHHISVPGRIVLLAVGKAAGGMAAGAWRTLGPRIDQALIVTPVDGVVPDRLADERATVVTGEHPLPGVGSLRAGRLALELAESLGPADLLLGLVSGGASSLMELPRAGVALDDIANTTRRMTEAGASIQRLNEVRRDLSALKGGGLAEAAAPANVLGLLLSDVVGDEPADIGSGPTVASDPARVYNVIVGDNRLLLEGASAEATRLGYRVHTLGRALHGEARDVGRRIAEQARQTAATPGPPTCLLGAGETTVTLHGDGLGGRNQELALAAALQLDGVPGVCLCSAGSDGKDGPTSAAGAVVDGRTVRRGSEAGMDAREYLARNDSWRYFDALGAHVVTGPTGTNLMDLQIVTIERRSG